MGGGMDANDVGFATARDLAADIRVGQVSPVEVVDALLARIERLNPQTNAFCLVLDDEARAAARSAEEAVRRGETLGPLHGVPVAIKDQMNVTGARVAFGSRLLAD